MHTVVKTHQSNQLMFVIVSLNNSAKSSHSDMAMVSKRLFGAGFMRLLITEKIT